MHRSKLYVERPSVQCDGRREECERRKEGEKYAKPQCEGSQAMPGNTVANRQATVGEGC